METSSMHPRGSRTVSQMDDELSTFSFIFSNILRTCVVLNAELEDTPCNIFGYRQKTHIWKRILLRHGLLRDDALPYFLLLVLRRHLLGLPPEHSDVAAMAACRWRQARPLLLDDGVLFPFHGVARPGDLFRQVVGARTRGHVDLESPCGDGNGVLGEGRLHEVDVRCVLSRAWKILHHPGSHGFSVTATATTAISATGCSPRCGRRLEEEDVRRCARAGARAG